MKKGSILNFAFIIYSLKIMPKAIVCECDDSIFYGDITVSSGCIIHPRVTIIAKSGPIIIGENCLIEEYTTIIHDTGDDTCSMAKPPVLVIGANNVFEVGSRVEANKIGEKNLFECKCYVSSAVMVTNNCIIGAGCQLIGEQTLSENSIIHGRSCAERESIEKSVVCCFCAAVFLYCVGDLYVYFNKIDQTFSFCFK